MMNSKELYNFHKSLYSKAVFNSQYPKSLLEQDYNWQDEFFRTGVIQDYYISVKGGSQKVGYYAGLNYYGEEGTLVGTGMQRVNGNFNMNAEIAKWLDMNVKVNFTKSYRSYAASWTTLADAFMKMPGDNPMSWMLRATPQATTCMSTATRVRTTERNGGRRASGMPCIRRNTTIARTRTSTSTVNCN